MNREFRFSCHSIVWFLVTENLPRILSFLQRKQTHSHSFVCVTNDEHDRLRMELMSSSMNVFIYMEVFPPIDPDYHESIITNA